LLYCECIIARGVESVEKKINLFFNAKKPHPRFQGWGWGCGGEIIYKPLCSMYFPSSKNKQNME
jgi:hypothetical protein